MKDTWTHHHVGIPVKDLDVAMANFAAIGAEFQTPFLIDSRNMAEYLVYGKTPDPAVQTRGVMGKMGTMGIELLQPVAGHTVHRELLEKSGEGIGHIAYKVENLAAETAELEHQGFEVILSIRPKDRRTALYIDTRGRLSNLIIELMQG